MMFRAIAGLALPILLATQTVYADKVEDTLEQYVEKAIPLRTHSLNAPYVDSDLQNRWWDFGADTIINTNKHVRLTQDKPSQTGWLWSRMPISVSNWQLDFEFKVDGKSHNLFGDGFALWVAKDRAKVGPVFGSVDYFTGLGVFFDTYANARHPFPWPRVTAMMGDGKTAYDNDNDNVDNELAACSENFRRRDHPTKARLTYIKGRGLQLKLQIKNTDDWQVCFESQAALPDSPYIGFSAITGDVSDAHDIISVSMSSLTLKRSAEDLAARPGLGDQSPLGAKSQTSNKSKARKSKSGSSGAAAWFLFFLKMVGVLAFCAFAMAAYRTYSAQKKSKRAW